MMPDALYFSMSKIWFDALQVYLECYKTVMGVNDINSSKNLYIDGNK